MPVQKSFNIGEKAYIIEALPATKGMKAVIVLFHIVGGIAEGISDHKEDFLDIDINIGKIIDGVFRRLDVSGTPTFIRELVLDSVIRPEMTEESFDEMFSAKYEDLILVVTEIIKLNGFVDVIKKKVQEVMEELSSNPILAAKFTHSSNGQ